jgi:hypothetical protein
MDSLEYQLYVHLVSGFLSRSGNQVPGSVSRGGRTRCLVVDQLQLLKGVDGKLLPVGPRKFYVCRGAKTPPAAGSLQGSHLGPRGPRPSQICRRRIITLLPYISLKMTTFLAVNLTQPLADRFYIYKKLWTASYQKGQVVQERVQRLAGIAYTEHYAGVSRRQPFPLQLSDPAESLGSDGSDLEGLKMQCFCIQAADMMSDPSKYRYYVTYQIPELIAPGVPE